MAVELTSAQRLHGFVLPRRKVAKAARLTSADTTDEQAPQ
jgi:hypothetical protein